MMCYNKTPSQQADYLF